MIIIMDGELGLEENGVLEVLQKLARDDNEDANREIARLNSELNAAKKTIDNLKHDRFGYQSVLLDLHKWVTKAEKAASLLRSARHSYNINPTGIGVITFVEKALDELKDE